MIEQHMESICTNNSLLTLALSTLLFLNSAQAYCVKKTSQSAHSPSSSSPSASPVSKSTTSSSSPSPTQSTSPSSSPSAPDSTPASPSPTSQSHSPESSIQMQSSSEQKSPSPSSEPSVQMQSNQASAPSTPQESPHSSPSPISPSTTTLTLTPMDSPDGEVSSASSPTSSTPTDDVLKTSKIVANNESLKKICGSTDYPDLCLESISPFFNGKTDAVEVLAMAINASNEQTKLALKSIDELSKKPETVEEIGSALQDCKESFEYAMENLKAAHDAIAGNKISTINIMLSAAVTDYVTCTEANSGSNALVDQSKKLNEMASNCLAIAALHK